MMTNSCKIDARKSNATKWKMTPTWRQHGGRNPSTNEKTIQKNITKNDAKMKRPKAPDPKGH